PSDTAGQRHPRIGAVATRLATGGEGGTLAGAGEDRRQRTARRCGEVGDSGIEREYLVVQKDNIRTTRQLATRLRPGPDGANAGSRARTGCENPGDRPSTFHVELEFRERTLGRALERGSQLSCGTGGGVSGRGQDCRSRLAACLWLQGEFLTTDL